MGCSIWREVVLKIREINDSTFAVIIGFNITLYPFIFYIGKPTDETRIHEYVHVEQINRVGWFYFYSSYLFYYFKNRLKGMSKHDAYMAIPWEIEAHKKAGL
jgi:hypothetical protein